jgi:hypothetical protein
MKRVDENELSDYVCSVFQLALTETPTLKLEGLSGDHLENWEDVPNDVKQLMNFFAKMFLAKFIIVEKLDRCSDVPYAKEPTQELLEETRKELFESDKFDVVLDY